MPLCFGLSSSLAEREAPVGRLAEKIVPQLDLDRLHGIEVSAP